MWFFFSGYFLVFHFFGKKNNINCLIFSYPISTVITVIYLQIISILGFEITGKVLIFCEAIKLISFIKFRFKLEFKNFKYLLLILFVLFLPYFLIPWITHDSAMFSLYSNIIQNSNILNFPEAGLVSYGFFLSCLNAFYNNFTGSPFSVSITFLFGISFLIMLISIFIQIFEKKNINLNLLLIFLIILSTPLFVLGFIYFHNNLISSFFLFGIYMLLQKYFLKKEKFNDFLIFLLIVGFISSRMENGIIFSIFTLFILINFKEILISKLGIYCGIFYSYLWYSLILFKSFDYSGVILSPKTTIIILISLFVLNICLIFDLYLKKFSNLLNEKAIFILLLVIFFTPFLFFPINSFLSISSLAINAGGGIGKWSIFWYMFLILFFITDSNLLKKNYPSKQNSRVIILNITLMIFVLIFIMSFFRVPYRLGYGDSGNRLMITVFPFAVHYILICLSILKNKKKSFFFTK